MMKNKALIISIISNIVIFMLMLLCMLMMYVLYRYLFAAHFRWYFWFIVETLFVPIFAILNTVLSVVFKKKKAALIIANAGILCMMAFHIIWSISFPMLKSAWYCSPYFIVSIYALLFVVNNLVLNLIFKKKRLSDAKW